MLIATHTVRPNFSLDQLTSNKNFILGVKIISVAAATSVFLIIQFRSSVAFGGAAAVTASALTLFSEKVIRPLNPAFTDSNWINTEINKARLKDFVYKRLIYTTLAVTIIFGLIFPPIQAIAVAIQAMHLKILLLVCVIAPIAEEVLFRGFIQERIEDVLIVVDRFVMEIKSAKITQWATKATNFLFGAVHIIGNQVATVAAQIYIVAVIYLLGSTFSDFKNRDNGSLLSPIAAHMAQNISFTTGLILAKHLFG